MQNERTHYTRPTNTLSTPVCRVISGKLCLVQEVKHVYIVILDFIAARHLCQFFSHFSLLPLCPFLHWCPSPRPSSTLGQNTEIWIKLCLTRSVNISRSMSNMNNRKWTSSRLFASSRPQQKNHNWTQRDNNFIDDCVPMSPMHRNIWFYFIMHCVAPEKTK